MKDKPSSIRLEIEQRAEKILESARSIQENMQKGSEESEYNFAERKSQIGTGYSQQARIGLGLEEAHMGHSMLAFCKHKGFSEENEYRIVIKLRNHSMIKYRTRNGIVIPYLELELPKDLSSIMTEIYFGPGLNKNLARSGLTELLSNSGFSEEKINDLIREPNVPYRP